MERDLWNHIKKVNFYGAFDRAHKPAWWRQFQAYGTAQRRKGEWEKEVHITEWGKVIST